MKHINNSLPLANNRGLNENTKRSILCILFFSFLFQTLPSNAGPKRKMTPTYYMKEESDGSISFTDSPQNYKEWTVVIKGVSRSGSRFKDYIQNFYQYDTQIRSTAKALGVPAALVKAVMMAESAFNPEAISSSGAQGLMQLIPGTAKLVGCLDPWDPNENIIGGTRYLKMMLTRFNNDIRLAVAGYNAGPKAVERYLGIPPYPETQEYVRRVESLYEEFVRNDLSLDNSVQSRK